MAVNGYLEFLKGNDALEDGHFTAALTRFKTASKSGVEPSAEVYARKGAALVMLERYPAAVGQYRHALTSVGLTPQLRSVINWQLGYAMRWQFRSRVQGRHESVREFARALEVLYDRAFTDAGLVGQAVIDVELLDCFIRGLLPTLRYAVFRSCPDSFREAVDTASLAEMWQTLDA